MFPTLILISSYMEPQLNSDWFNVFLCQIEHVFFSTLFHHCHLHFNQSGADNITNKKGSHQLQKKNKKDCLLTDCFNAPIYKPATARELIEGRVQMCISTPLLFFHRRIWIKRYRQPWLLVLSNQLHYNIVMVPSFRCGKPSKKCIKMVEKLVGRFLKNCTRVFVKGLFQIQQHNDHETLVTCKV